MIFSYDYFIQGINRIVGSDDDFYYDLLKKVICNPERYTGIFRLSNAKTKLIQNVTQSREIRFGDFMEDIVTEYIGKMGYNNLHKIIGTDENGDILNADQVFTKDDTVYLIEQKIRDDHDSTKKRGQIQNFKKKYDLLHRKYPDNKINATMWFIDGSLVKNKKYYMSELEMEHEEKIELHIYYGGDLFVKLFNREDIWQEICDYLLKNKQERNNEVLNIPDFDTSEEFLRAIRRLKTEEPSLYSNLLSNVPKYVSLRQELFPTGKNLKMV